MSDFTAAVYVQGGLPRYPCHGGGSAVNCADVLGLRLVSPAFLNKNAYAEERMGIKPRNFAQSRFGNMSDSNDLRQNSDLPAIRAP
ncbi:MAG: hypothetical protein ACTTKL_01915 [Treponema sp.]